MTLTQIISQAGHVGCICGALPEHECSCRPGVHLSRVIRARRIGLVTLDDVAYVIRQFPSAIVKAVP